MNEEIYCEVCCESFPVDEETGEVKCNCESSDPYADNPHKRLDFND